MTGLLSHAKVARMREVARRFAPRVPSLDQSHSFDRRAFDALGAAGLFGHDSFEGDLAGIYGAVLGSRDLGLGASLCAQMCGVHTLAAFGSERTRDALTDLRRGRACISLANSEPGKGTDLLALETRAHATDEGFALTGHKGYVTNVGEAEWHVVSARIEGRPRSLSHFLIEAQAPGVEATRVEDLLGLRTSTTGNLRLDDAPAHCLVGEVGQGLEIFRLQFDLERLFTGALYVAALTLALERALEHLDAREDDLGRHQYVQDKLVRARIARDLHASHLWVMAGALGRGEDVRGSLSAAKLHGLEAAQQSVRELQSLLGGAGVRADEPLAKIGRDLQTLTMLGGSAELHKIVTYRELRS